MIARKAECSQGKHCLSWGEGGAQFLPLEHLSCALAHLWSVTEKAAATALARHPVARVQAELISSAGGLALQSAAAASRDARADGRAAEDLAQEIRLEFCKTARGGGVYNARFSAHALVWRIAFRVARRLERYFFEGACLRPPSQHETDDTAIPGEALARLETVGDFDAREAFKFCLREVPVHGLSRGENETFASWLGGAEPREISTATGRSLNAVKMSLHKAMTKARRAIVAHYELRAVVLPNGQTAAPDARRY